MRSLLISSIVGLALALAMTSASPAANVGEGKIIARRSCETCHNYPPLPNLEEIAQSRTDKQLMHYLASQHPKMPDFQLSSDQITDLVAYIRSLHRNYRWF